VCPNEHDPGVHLRNIKLCRGSRPQEVGGTLIGEDRLVVMAGAVLVEWYQIHQTWFPGV
jgi:hypothetical protein